MEDGELIAATARGDAELYRPLRVRDPRGHGDISPQSVVVTIDAGNVGCPALSP